MINIQSGILDKTRMVSNILMLILVAGNIYFSIQYIQYTNDIRAQEEQAAADNVKFASRLQSARFLREFIDIVLNTKGTISYDDRVKLESDIRQIQDPDLTSQWNKFVASKDSKTAQDGAVKLMSLLSAKMI